MGEKKGEKKGKGSAEDETKSHWTKTLRKKERKKA